MTKGIIDALEIIHIEHHDGKRNVRGERIVQDVLERAFHGAAVHQTSERITLGENDELAVHRLPLFRHGIDKVHEVGDDRSMIAELRRYGLVNRRFFRLALAEADADHHEIRLHEPALAAEKLRVGIESVRGHGTRDGGIFINIVRLQHDVMPHAVDDEDGFGREFAKLRMCPLRFANDGDGIARRDAQTLSLSEVGADIDAAVGMNVHETARQRRAVSLQAHGEGLDARKRFPAMAYAEIVGEEFTRGLFVEFDDRALICHARDLHLGSKRLPAE